MTVTKVLVPVLVQDVDKTLTDFWDYCLLSERLTERVSKDYQYIIRRYLKFADGVVSRKTVKGYMSTYLKKAPKTYNNQLD